MTAPDTVDTKSALIQCGIDLMLEKGWAGFSYKDIADRVGIRKASIHYHFPSKEDLGLAIIAMWREGFSQIHQQAEAEHANVFERLFSMNVWMQAHHCDHHICPFGILDADFMNLPASMQHETQTWRQATLDTYSRWFDDGRQQKSLTFMGAPEEQALCVLSGFQGSVQMERTLKNDAFKRYSHHLFESLKV